MSLHAVQERWPAKHPDRIQLYTFPTPNGVKVSIALEEMELPYEAHSIHIGKGDQHTPEYLAISPNGKIPTLFDPDGPNHEPIALMESGAILYYLAEKTGKFMPSDPLGKSETLQWLFFQVGHIGPMFGQFGHFHKFAKDNCDHPYPLERYKNETRRLLGVLERRLTNHPFLLPFGYSVADIATFPWVEGLVGFYAAGQLLGFQEFPHVKKWLETCMERPAYKRAHRVGSPE
ncbi:MAG: glutathione S-transferase N-terminal domain-containing protein [Myxococcales bacterium]|nr:glutathione S-transferase N-terminal domain-containing protein [Myxococcales bacterium]MCB9641798.1 glutathione S-transferase N-terminal domain-containing protein [Myxococcales bacterium]